MAFCIRLAGFILALTSALYGGEASRWTMLNVTPNEGQADCNLIELPDGSQIMIDVADAWDAPDLVVAELRQRSVKHLALVVITHFHQDHYRRLMSILEAGIKIDHVALSIPAKRIADREIPWGADWNDIQRLLGQLRSWHVPFHVPIPGERLIETTGPNGVAVGLDVICAYNGADTPIGDTDVNDTSVITRFYHGKTSILFAGDLNAALGSYLAASKIPLQSTLLKVPHHGTEGVAPDTFFDRVGASAALVPSPRTLWGSARSMRVRNYFADRKIPTYVSGINGNVTVTITNDGYSIETER